jgi:hypothetical protein
MYFNEFVIKRVREITKTIYHYTTNRFYLSLTTDLRIIRWGRASKENAGKTATMSSHGE